MKKNICLIIVFMALVSIKSFAKESLIYHFGFLKATENQEKVEVTYGITDAKNAETYLNEENKLSDVLETENYIIAYGNSRYAFYLAKKDFDYIQEKYTSWKNVAIENDVDSASKLILSADVIVANLKSDYFISKGKIDFYFEVNSGVTKISTGQFKKPSLTNEYIDVILHSLEFQDEELQSMFDDLSEEHRRKVIAEAIEKEAKMDEMFQ